MPILDFIAKYTDCQDEFLNGWCYAFANMLAHKYQGEIYYLPKQYHFICKVNNEFYDVRGQLDKNKIGEHPYRWKDYQRDFREDAAIVLKSIIIKPI